MTTTRTYYLELNAVPLATYAWEIPDLSPLLDSPAIRGSDRLLPQLPGVRPYPRVVTATIITLPLDVVGDVDEDGDPYTDVFEGLITNMAYLNANLGLAETGDGTVPAVFYRGDLNSLTADVTFLGFKGTSTKGKNLIRTTFDISVPAGAWTDAGS